MRSYKQWIVLLIAGLALVGMISRVDEVKTYGNPKYVVFNTPTLIGPNKGQLPEGLYRARCQDETGCSYTQYEYNRWYDEAYKSGYSRQNVEYTAWVEVNLDNYSFESQGFSKWERLSDPDYDRGDREYK